VLGEGETTMRVHAWRIALVLLGSLAMVVSTGPPGHAAPGSGATVFRPHITYYLVTARHSGKCLDLDSGLPDDGTPIIQWTCHGRVNQQWRLSIMARGYYEVSVAQTGKCLGIANKSTADGADVVQLSCDFVMDRLWRIVELSDGYLRFVSAISDKCMDVRDVSQDDGARIQQWSCTTGENQQWRIRE
jgi:hypothetical protein